MTVASYLSYYAVLGSVGIIGAVLVGLRIALTRTGWSARERNSTIATTGAVLAGWLAVTGGLAWLGAYQGAANGVPTIQFGIFAPILIGLLLYWRVPSVARLIEAVPQQWLVGVQLYRVLGAVFVVLFAAGELPGLFALPAGLGDLAVGLLAPLIARSWVRRPRESAGAVWSWNTLGLADLAVALATGFATSPSPFQIAAVANPNDLISAFPLVLIPVFLVPLSVLLHLASLAKLRRSAAEAGCPINASVARA